MFVRKTLLFLTAGCLAASAVSAQVTCPPPGAPLSGPATITANIAAIDQPFMLNRFGAAMPQGMIFALKSDVIPVTGNTAGPGNAMLRPDKRPRPIVLRIRQGDCLQITLYNYLGAANTNLGSLQPVTNEVGFHVNGMQLVNTIADDGSQAGQNPTPSGMLCNTLNSGCTTQSMTYTLYAAASGAYLAYSTAAMTGGNNCGNCGGQLTAGLFGSVTVEPPTAEIYRSQVTAVELGYAQQVNTYGQPVFTPNGQPQINYTARYPANFTPPDGPNAGPQPCWPVLAMVALPATVSNGQCVTQSGPLTTYYTDLTAIITGPNQGVFTVGGPDFAPVSVTPNRNYPFREFSIHYHEVESAVQAFPDYYYSPWTGYTNTVGAIQDQFAINYGTGGIGSEILANRLNVGPNAGPSQSSQAACVECKFEEFFLSAWAVGDPAMVVDYPANSPGTTADKPNVESATTAVLTTCALSPATAGNNGANPPPPPLQSTTCAPPFVPLPQKGRKATMAFYPDDPSNVYHSYLDDHVTFRILHAGVQFTHIHHQHAHQWLHTPNNQDGSYLDSQLISPGAAFTLEMVHNGSGNRNKTIGDSIFHCHFYPHFAAGMWSMWRVHDVFEAGTQLSNGIPVSGARALPDGEIANGTPIPAIVPLPTYAMAPVPAKVQIVPVCATNISPCTNANATGFQANTIPNGNGTYSNPGYPFFIPGVAGHRPPRPPLDVADLAPPSCSSPTDPVTCLDGGLPRHVILAGTVTNEQHNQWDFSKDNFALLTSLPPGWTCPMTVTQPGFTVPSGSLYNFPAGCANGCINALQIPESGTPVEKATMAFMGNRNIASYTPTGQPGNFVTNGLPRGPQPGAPYADPAVDDNGNAIGTMRRYKVAVVQTDLAFSKAGWHYPQQRFETLWDDVQSAVNGGSSTYTPQPLFFRANSVTDFVEFWHTNLVPSYYELDDYQVRTPTDILGQHIHLVKFDVLASDGAANGFNYEDGTLSPDEVRDRIGAIRNWNACTSTDSRNGTFPCPVPKAPLIGSATAPTGQCWLGAQTTIQRWYADDVTGCVDGRQVRCNESADRTLRTVFTHDHFGPSTHQQVGLYAGLLIEPTNSTWTDAITGVQLGSNTGRPDADGGPTSWQAIISQTAQNPGYREFALEFQDLTHAYLSGSVSAAVGYSPYANGPIGTPGSPTTCTLSTTCPPAWGWVDCANVINGPNGGPAGSPCAATLSSVTPVGIDSKQILGTMSVNYRSEPLPLRVQPNSTPASCNGSVAGSIAIDLAHAYSSICRQQGYLNVQPTGSINSASGSSFTFPPVMPGAQPLDPYTPILQAYQGDNVQVRVLVGAHFFNHNFGMQGIKWLFEPSNGSSGWRDNQAMGISEHFEYLFNVPATAPPSGSTPPPFGLIPFTDYLYTPGSGIGDQGQGLWGMLRAFNTSGKSSLLMPNLQAAPGNGNGGVPAGATTCPSGQNPRTYYVAAISPLYVAPSTSFTYYTRNGQTVQNQQPIVYVPADSSGNPLTTTPSAPLVLRANSGDCINVVLFNQFTYPTTNNAVFTTADGGINGGYPLNSASTFPLQPSTYAGLHAQLVSLNSATSNGVNVGYNLSQYGDTTVAAGNATDNNCIGVSGGPNCIQYQWYAGNIAYNNSTGAATYTPVEFGSANLLSADPLEQQPHGMIGSVIIEPPGTIWCNAANTTCSGAFGSATVGNVYDTTANLYQNSALQFTEFVGMVQDNIYLTSPLSAGVFNAFNYGTEPFALRYFGYTGNSSTIYTGNGVDLSQAFSNFLPVSQGSTTLTGDLQPGLIYQVTAGNAVRWRLLHPDGNGGFPDNIFTLHGHVWQEEPYVSDASGNPSALLGNNITSQWMGARDGFGPQNHFDVLLSSAGGPNKVAGDYLFESFTVQEGPFGIWGVMRVNPAAPTLKAAALSAKRQFPTAKPVQQKTPAKDPGDRFLKPRDKKAQKTAQATGTTNQ
jgi:hypothetical protein